MNRESDDAYRREARSPESPIRTDSIQFICCKCPLCPPPPKESSIEIARNFQGMCYVLLLFLPPAR